MDANVVNVVKILTSFALARVDVFRSNKAMLARAWQNYAQNIDLTLKFQIDSYDPG